MDELLDTLNGFEWREEDWGASTPYDQAYEHIASTGFHDEAASAIMWMVADGRFDVLGVVLDDASKLQVVELDRDDDWALTPWGEWWGFPADLGDGWGLLREILAQDEDDADRDPIAVAHALAYVWPGADRNRALDHIQQAEERR